MHLYHSQLIRYDCAVNLFCNIYFSQDLYAAFSEALSCRPLVCSCFCHTHEHMCCAVVDQASVLTSRDQHNLAILCIVFL